jgi:hypothetical protein
VVVFLAFITLQELKVMALSIQVLASGKVLAGGFKVNGVSVFSLFRNR